MWIRSGAEKSPEKIRSGVDISVFREYNMHKNLIRKPTAKKGTVMRISIKKDVLLKALQKVCNIIGSRTTLPILANVLIETGEDGKLTLTTTDLELRISTRVEADIQEAGSTTIPAKRLIGLVSKFKNEDVLIETNENHHSKITCGTAEFMLLGLDPRDFPAPVAFEPQRKLKLKQADFSRIIDRISYAASFDDARKFLHGILLSVKEGNLTAVATDGKRLALVEKLLDEAPEGSDGDIIITIKAAAEAKRVMEKEGDIFIEIGNNQVIFRIGDTVITSKLIEGAYPQYRQVIPTAFSKQVELPCRAFVDALEIVSIPLFDSSAYVKLTFSANQLKFEANSINIGEGHETIPVEYGFEDVSVSFNPQFLADPFKRLDVEKVTMKMNDAMSPIAIKSNDGFLYVIMPMRKN